MGGVFECRCDVLRFEIRIVIKDLRLAHASSEQIQNQLHRIAQTTDRGLAEADGWIDRDA